jgi:hypothetical protein
VTFVRWTKAGGKWHIERTDGFAVCGIGGELMRKETLIPERLPRIGSVCKNCDRMKCADTVRLA